MTTSAQRGHMAFCAYDTPVGEGTLDPTDDTTFLWQRHKATEVSMAPQEFSDVYAPEVGESVYPLGTYKLGAYVGGTMTLDARLESAFGHLLYAVAGSHVTIAAAGSVVAGTTFKPAADTTSLPWLAVRRMIPNESGTGTTEYFIDCRLNAMTLTLPQMGIMQVQCAVVGRKPVWDDSADVVTGTAFEGSKSLAFSHSTQVELAGFATELGTAGGGKFTGGQIILTNGTTTPQQEMILGSMYPDTFLPLARNAAIRLVYKWKDNALYKKLWEMAATGSPTGYDKVWNPAVVSSAVKITMNAITAAAEGKDPYKLVFNADNVDWTMSSPTLVPGRMLQTELTGIAKAVPSADPWSLKLYNGVAYTFGA